MFVDVFDYSEDGIDFDNLDKMTLADEILNDTFEDYIRKKKNANDSESPCKSKDGNRTSRDVIVLDDDFDR